MIKTTLMSAAAMAMLALPTTASAFVHHHYHGSHHYHMLHHGTQHHHVHSNGFCNGRVDGTGLRHHCGTATGGPVGGLPGHS